MIVMMMKSTMDDVGLRWIQNPNNCGRSTKKRRSDSAASGSAKPPPKDDDQSSKKPRESDASASKQHPTLTSTGWQINGHRDAGADLRLIPEGQSKFEKSYHEPLPLGGPRRSVVPDSILQVNKLNHLPKTEKVQSSHSSQHVDKETWQKTPDQYYAARITKMDSMILEFDIIDQVMQCTTRPRHSELSKEFLNIPLCETLVCHNEDGNMLGDNIKTKAHLGYLKDGDRDGNSQFLSGQVNAQDGDPSQDDVRLCLDDDLKKAQDHSQRQAGDLP
ncbi:hypothetical protein Tco_0487047 [Tanacetum coccineum]